MDYDLSKRLRRLLGAINARIEGRLWYRPTFRPGTRVLDLGCGPSKLTDAVGVDISRLPGVDVLCNFEQAIPFSDNSFDVVYTSHVLEHINDLALIMKEIHRLLKEGGLLMVSTPYSGSFKAFQDPTHVRSFSLHTFDYFCSAQHEVPGWYFDFNFRQVCRRALVFRTTTIVYNPIFGIIFNLSPFMQQLYERSFLSIFQADELQVEILK